MATQGEVRDTEGEEIGRKGKAARKGIDLPEKIRFPIESMAWARAQDRIREVGAYTPPNDDKSDAIEAAKNAVRKAINGMAAHWRMAFTAAKTTEAEGRITAVSLNVLNYPKLPTLSNGDPSFSLDWVAEHEDGGLYVSLTIKTGRFASLPVEVNFDKGQLGRQSRTISDRWGDTYPIEPYPVKNRP